MEEAVAEWWPGYDAADEKRLDGGHSLCVPSN
jgi:hypothetical protein